MNHITYDIYDLIKNNSRMYLKKPTSDFNQLNIRNFHINNRFKTELATLVGFDYNLINQFISIINEGEYDSMIFRKSDGSYCYLYGNEVLAQQVIAPDWVLLGQSVVNDENRNVIICELDEDNNTTAVVTETTGDVTLVLRQAYLLHIKGDVAPYQTIEFSTLVNNYFKMLNPNSNLQSITDQTGTSLMNTYITLMNNFIKYGLKHGLIYVKRNVGWYNKQDGTLYYEFLNDDYRLTTETLGTEWNYTSSPTFEFLDGSTTIRNWLNIEFLLDAQIPYKSAVGSYLHVPAWGVVCITTQPLITDTVKTKLFTIQDNAGFFSYVYDCSTNFINPNDTKQRWLTYQPHYQPISGQSYENTYTELVFTFEINYSNTATLSFLNINDLTINNIYLLSAINQYNFIIAVDGDDVNFIMSYIMKNDEINMDLMYKDVTILFVDDDEEERYDPDLKRVYINKEYLKQSYLRIEWN